MERHRRGISAWVLFVALVTAQVGWAVKPCTIETERDKTCTTTVKKLRPTQFAVGMREVREKKAKIEEMDARELDKYLEKHPIPIVIAPDGGFYLTDHHHLARALADADTKETNEDKEVYAEVERNWSDKDTARFWEKMEEHHFVYLYDEKGDGPKSHTALPRTVKGLKDDPYRSLAAEVREEGGFEKSDEPFAEFRWANYFRKHVTIGAGEAGWRKAVKDALGWAKRPAAKNLPGFTG